MMLVRELMHEGAVSCAPWDTLQTVGQLMWDNDCGAIPVVDSDQRPVSIVTDRDIAMAATLNHCALAQLTVGQITVGKALVTCTDGDDAETVLRLMAEHQVRRLPVVDRFGKLAGMVSTKELVDHSTSRKDAGDDRLPYADTVRVLQRICAAS